MSNHQSCRPSGYCSPSPASVSQVRLPCGRFCEKLVGHPTVWAFGFLAVSPNKVEKNQKLLFWCLPWWDPGPLKPTELSEQLQHGQEEVCCYASNVETFSSFLGKGLPFFAGLQHWALGYMTVVRTTSKLEIAGDRRCIFPQSFPPPSHSQHHLPDPPQSDRYEEKLVFWTVVSSGQAGFLSGCFRGYFGAENGLITSYHVFQGETGSCMGQCSCRGHLIKKWLTKSKDMSRKLALSSLCPPSWPAGHHPPQVSSKEVLSKQHIESIHPLHNKVEWATA